MLRSAFNVEHPYDSIGWMATPIMCADTMGDTLVCKDDQSEPLCICLATIIFS